MLKTFLYLILVLLILSCNKNEGDPACDYQYPAFITAGQNSGEGIRYVDIEPDDTICYHFCYPFKIYSLDLDNDGIVDFELKFEISYPWTLSSGYEILNIIPLENSSVYVSELNYNWVKPLVFDDTISYNNNWSDSTALLYSRHWNIWTPSIIEGYWSGNDYYFIGIKIAKKDYQSFGWIHYGYHGLKIKQYAITIPCLK